MHHAKGDPTLYYWAENANDRSIESMAFMLYLHSITITLSLCPHSCKLAFHGKGAYDLNLKQRFFGGKGRSFAIRGGGTKLAKAA